MLPENCGQIRSFFFVQRRGRLDEMLPVSRSLLLVNEAIRATDYDDSPSSALEAPQKVPIPSRLRIRIADDKGCFGAGVLGAHTELVKLVYRGQP
ncbi:MAG: hypothetical protein KC766_08295 [Myxococcales bacterium]|nr:hypothetical protein [Myxococcales bacterium]